MPTQTESRIREFHGTWIPRTVNFIVKIAALAAPLSIMTGAATAGEWKKIATTSIPGFARAVDGNVMSGYGAKATIDAQGYSVSGAASARCETFDVLSSKNSYSVNCGTTGLAMDFWVHIGDGVGEVELIPVVKIAGIAEILSGEGDASMSGFSEYTYRTDYTEKMLKAEIQGLGSATAVAIFGGFSSPFASVTVTSSYGGGQAHMEVVNSDIFIQCPAGYFFQKGRTSGQLKVTAWQTMFGPPKSFTFAQVKGTIHKNLSLLSHKECP